MKNFKTKIDTITTTNNGSKWHDAYDAIIDNFTSLEESEKNEFIETMIRYADKGPLNFKYSCCISAVVDCIDENDERYTDFFYKQLCSKNKHKKYWAIEGYIKCLKMAALPNIVKFILDIKQPIECRGKAVKEISKLTNQPFDYCKPTDPGYWKKTDIDTTAIEEWQANGFPKGTGYPEQIRSSGLDNPKNDFEKIMAKLDKKLVKKRLRNNDLSNPSNILIMSDDEKRNKVIHQLGLQNASSDYLEFLKDFSPVQVFISCKKYKNVTLYGIDELELGQQGYSSYNKTKLETWNSNFLVIADSSSDPFCIQLDNSDSHIYFARHGGGKWDFEIVENSFLDFIKELSKA